MEKLFLFQEWACPFPSRHTFSPKLTSLTHLSLTHLLHLYINPFDYPLSHITFPLFPETNFTFISSLFYSLLLTFHLLSSLFHNHSIFPFSLHTPLTITESHTHPSFLFICFALFFCFLFSTIHFNKTTLWVKQGHLHPRGHMLRKNNIKGRRKICQKLTRPNSSSLHMKRVKDSQH